jgi:HK97 family phage major capsid protein
MEGEFRSLTKRWEKAEELYNREQGSQAGARDADRVARRPARTTFRHARGVPGEDRTLTKVWDTPEYRSAYWHYLTAKNLAELDIEEQRVLSKATAGAGANLVPTTFYNQIINILRFTGPINQLASVMTTDSGEAIQIPAVSAHGVATWTAENAAYTASDETFGQITLNAFKAGRTVIVSEELLTDAAFGLEGYLAQELGTSIGVLEETAFAVGDGSGKPLGLATTGNGVTVSTAAVGQLDVVHVLGAGDVRVRAAVPVPPQRGLDLLRHRVRNLYTMVDTQNRPLWAVNTPPPARTRSSATRSTRRRIWRRPACRTTSPGIFGDINQAYQIRRVNGFSLQRQNELYSNNGQVGFRGFERVDGRIRNASAAIVLQHSAT